MSFYQICWFFVIYSFIGWAIEVAFHAVTLGKVVNRGFLNGPVCPVYGFGMLLVLVICSFLPVNEQTGQINAFLVFLTGLLFTTMVELIAGWALDKLFHARWWDYTDMPFNFHGYICLAFSLIWGLAVMIAVKFAHPLIVKFSLAAIPPKYGWWILAALYAILIADVVITVASVQGLNKKLKQLDELQKALRKPSDKISETIAENTIKVVNSVEKAQVKVALGKAELKDSIEERKKQLEQIYLQTQNSIKWTQKRLLKAFPKIHHTQYTEALQSLKSRLQKKK